MASLPCHGPSLGGGPLQGPCSLVGYSCGNSGGPGLGVAHSIDSLPPRLSLGAVHPAGWELLNLRLTSSQGLRLTHP